MDFVRLIENGEYKKEDLNVTNFAFVSGMEKALELLDGMFGDEDFVSFSPTLQKIQKEFAEEALRTAKEWLRLNICEAIVELADAEAAEKDNNE